MASVVVDSSEAKSRFSELIQMAVDGAEVIVARNGNPVAKIIPWSPDRQLGRWAGRVSYAVDPVGSDEDVTALFE